MTACPYDLHLRVEKDNNGKWRLRNVTGQNGTARHSQLAKHLHFTRQEECRHPGRPMLQVKRALSLHRRRSGLVRALKFPARRIRAN
jgi:hypothetical protein